MSNVSLIHETLKIYFENLIPYLYHLSEDELLKLPINYFENKVINDEYIKFYDYILLMNQINEKIELLNIISNRENKLNFLLKDIKNRFFF